MWCRCCNLETNENHCSVCGSQTVEDIPIQIYWCKNCSIPIIHLSTAVDKGICPICKGKTYYVEYEESIGTYQADIGVEFDLMFLETDIEDDNPFGEEIEDSGDESDDFFNSEELEQDIYEFDDVDQEIFQDPTLMIKWLKKQEGSDL